MNQFVIVMGENPWIAPLVLWPVVTALLSLGMSTIEARTPRLAAALKAAGLDLPGIVAALRRAK